MGAGSFPLLIHFHVPTQQTVDARLVTGSLATEPLQNIRVQANRDRLLDGGTPLRFLEKCFVQFWNFAEVYFLVGH